MNSNDPTQHHSDYECRIMLRDLYNGRSIVLPTSEEHARSMIMVGQRYLDDRIQHTFDTLKADYIA